MCHPAITAVITLASMAMSMAGQMMQTKAQKQAYRSAAKAAEHNRLMMRKLSDDALKRGKEDALKRMNQHRIALARARMRFRNIDTSWGSPLVAFDAIDLSAQRDAEMLLENSRRESWEYLERGKGYRMEAKSYRQAATYAGQAGAVRMVGSLMQTAYQVSQYMTPGEAGNLADPLVGASDSGYNYGVYSDLAPEPIVDFGYNPIGAT